MKTRTVRSPRLRNDKRLPRRWQLLAALAIAALVPSSAAEVARGNCQEPEAPAAPAQEPQPTEPKADDNAAKQEPAPAVPAPTAPAAPDGKTQAAVGPMVQTYLDKRKELRELDSQINRQLTSVSPSASADYQSMVKQLNQLRERKAALANEILEASVDAYLEAPDKYREVNDDLTKFMRSLLGEQGSGTRFDPEKARAAAERDPHASHVI